MTATCAHCSGTGYVETRGFLCGRGRCRTGAIRIRCSRCGGTGEENRERDKWREGGMRMREERRLRDETLSEAARRLGLRVTELSDMERGLREPMGSKGER